MARTRLVNGKTVPLTAAEETARDAEELAFATAPVVPEISRFEDDAAAIEGAGTLDALKTAIAAWVRKV